MYKIKNRKQLKCLREYRQVPGITNGNLISILVIDNLLKFKSNHQLRHIDSCEDRWKTGDYWREAKVGELIPFWVEGINRSKPSYMTRCIRGRCGSIIPLILSCCTISNVWRVPWSIMNIIYVTWLSLKI